MIKASRAVAPEGFPNGPVPILNGLRKKTGRGGPASLRLPKEEKLRSPPPVPAAVPVVVVDDPQDLEVDDVPIRPSARRLPSKVALERLASAHLACLVSSLADDLLQSTELSKNPSPEPDPPTRSAGRAASASASAGRLVRPVVHWRQVQ
jgi:hypothetical protein